MHLFEYRPMDAPAAPAAAAVRLHPIRSVSALRCTDEVMNDFYSRADNFLTFVCEELDEARHGAADDDSSNNLLSLLARVMRQIGQCPAGVGQNSDVLHLCEQTRQHRQRWLHQRESRRRLVAEKDTAKRAEEKVSKRSQAFSLAAASGKR